MSSFELERKLEKAIQEFRLSNLSMAENLLKEILDIEKAFLPALHILGIIKAIQLKPAEAVTYFKKALAINPHDGSIRYNLAKALSDMGNLAEALQHHRKACELSPQNPDAWLNYAKDLASLMKYEDALSAINNSLKFSPDSIGALLNKGAILKELNQYEEAIRYADLVLKRNPNQEQALLNKGAALKELHHYDQAMDLYERAIKIKPDYVEALQNIGNLNKELKKHKEAAESYKKLLNINPSVDLVCGDLIYANMSICNWTAFNENSDFIKEKIKSGVIVSNPYNILGVIDDPELQKKLAENYASSKYLVDQEHQPLFKKNSNGKIRIGYFSPDFREHAVAYLIAEIFELHHKDEFEIIAFSFGPDDNGKTLNRIKKAFNRFIDARSMTDKEVAALSRDLGIDIAVDLAGFTTYARFGIFAYRAAPIQVNFLGYPGTTGAKFIDYIIADRTLIPKESQFFYSEKIAYLPDTYQPNDRKSIISEKHFSKQELGLPEDSFVYCCFNNNFKITPDVFASWMRVLGVVGKGVLWLLEDNPTVVINLRKEAGLCGIDPQRLIFAKRLNRPEHLSRHQQADLFLDNLPYNAHTSASDALRMGLPLLTLVGKSFAGRVAASLLNAINMSELIATSQADYERIAIFLAENPDELAKLKLKLIDNYSVSPLFNSNLFTKNIENLYRKMFQRSQAGLLPSLLYAD